MLNDYFEKVRQPGQEISPILKFLGITVELISKDKTVLTMPIRPEFHHAGGLVAGGIVATLADEAMGHVAATNLSNNEGTATIEMNIRYLKIVKSAMVRAEASVVKRGRNVITVQANVKNESDDILAHAGASFIVFDIKSFFQAQNIESS